MTSPSDQALPRDPHDGVDPADNPEARASEQQGTQAVQRSVPGELAPPTDAPDHGEAPVVEGTGAGDPLAGVRIDESEAAAAVQPDDEPLR